MQPRNMSFSYMQYLKVAFLFLLIGYISGCAPVPLKYYEERKPLELINPIEESEVYEALKKLNDAEYDKCKKLHDGNDCKKKIDDDLSEKAKNFIALIKKHLPESYFDDKKSHSEQNPNEDRKLLNPSVEVTALNAKSKGKEPPILFTTLAPEGQKAVIEQLEKGEKNIDNNAKILEKLLKTLRSETATPAAPVPFNPYRQLHLSVSSSLNATHPADRLEKIYAFLYIPDAKIVDVEKLETERPTVNLGELTEEAKIKATLGVGKEESGIASIEPSYERSLKRQITKEYARRNIGINEKLDTLSIRQDGLEGIDLSGNVETTMTIQLPNNPEFLRVFSYDDTSKKPMAEPELYPFQDVGMIKGLVAWAIQARHVIAGGNTVLEGDDTEVPMVFQGIFPVTLWKNPEVFYFLKLDYKEQKANKMAVLAFPGPDGKPRLLAFTKFIDAIKVKDYIVKKYWAQQNNNKANNNQAPLKLDDNLSVGFTINHDGEIDNNMVNAYIALKNDKDELVDLRDLTVYMTEFCDLPLQDGFIWEPKSCD